jgi:molecular chaperone DnaK
VAKILGIDLGTVNSEAAVIEGGKETIIISAEGHRFFPSVVAFTKEGELLVGEPAKRQAVLNPERTIVAIKRHMGTSYKVKIDDKEYSPEQISAFILQKIKRDAEAYLGEEITKAVITVPAYFDDNQRQATKDAGRIAGLEVLRIINEPTAAALAYGLEKEGERKLAVYDFGGGTFDITIMEVGDGVFEVLSTNGDTQLGGKDLDKAVQDWIIAEFKKQHPDVELDAVALQRIVEAAETARIELSSSLQTRINLPFIAMGANGEPVHIDLTLTRAKLEELIEPIIDRTLPLMEQALADAKLKPSDIDNIVLVGATTRTPLIQKKVEEFFGKKPERGVDPMECVAIGAAIQGAVLSGEIKDIVLLDVTPLTLGVETLGGVMTPLIPRNTTIPTRKTEIFTTAADNQTAVTIHVLQGERPMAADNKSLGSFNLEGIPPAPRGIPQIEVTFDIDANGILHVTARDKATGKEQMITISGSTKLSEEEVERMRKEAELHAEEDRRKKEEVEARNNADSLIYTTEKTLKELGDKVSGDDRERVEKAITELKEALDKGTVDDIKRKTEALSSAIQQVSAAVYQKMAAEQAASGGAAAAGSAGGAAAGGDAAGGDGGTTVDAEFKVDDESKN